MCGGQQSGKAPRRSRRANGIVAPWSVAAAPKTPSKNSLRASSPSSIPPGGSTGPKRSPRRSKRRAPERRNGSVRALEGPQLSVVAVEGSKTFGASQNMPPAHAIDDNGREAS